MENYNSRETGQCVEQIAKDFLEKNGLTHEESNYFCKQGEIDLIMKERETLIFVEVRFRSDEKYGSALSSVSRSKQTKIIKTAKIYLLENNLFDNIDCRFDVITAETIKGQLVIDWYKNAFTENFI